MAQRAYPVVTWWLVTKRGVVLTLSIGVVLMTSLFDHAVSVCALAARQNSFFIGKRTMNGPPTRVITESAQPCPSGLRIKSAMTV